LSLEHKSQFIQRDSTKLTGLMLLAVLVLSACGSVQVGVEQTSVPATAASTDVVATPETTPEEVDQDPGDIGIDGPGPDQFWVPYAAGVGEGDKVIQVEEGEIKYSESPVSFALFFDYSPEVGRIVYGSEFWHAAEGSNLSVSDLWVFNYATGEESLLLDDNVGRALFSPTAQITDGSILLAAVVYNKETQAYDLALVDEKGEIDMLAPCASPSFSWSPDGTRIAYEARNYSDNQSVSDECTGVFVVSLADRSVTKIAGEPPSVGGWHGGQPIWAQGREALLLPYSYPESVFAVVPLDGAGLKAVDLSRSITEEYLPQPLLSLWAQDYNSVIGQTEGMMDPFGVWVYVFSDDLGTIEEAYRIKIDGRQLDLILVGWWEPGESVLLRDISNPSELNPFGRAIVWSLGERTWREVPTNLPEIEVNLYDDSVRTGSAPIDRAIETFLNGNADDRKALLEMVSAACVVEDFGVGPPQCPAGTPEGTQLEVFPYRLYRGTEFASKDELTDLVTFAVGGLYAVRPITDGFQETWWPLGDYELVFASEDRKNTIQVIVAEDGSVVRLEFVELTPVELLYGYSGDFILEPMN
ncbi:MAG: hypothetical protein PVF85_13020, partial [Anaerolineales bacterium]